MTSVSFFSGAVLSWIKQMALMNSTGNDLNPTTAVDSSGNVYTANVNPGTISKITAAGSVTQTWADLGVLSGVNALVVK